MKDILYITTIPSPYRVDYFNELGKKCNLTVLFEKSKSDERDENWEKHSFYNFNGIFMPGRKMTVNTAFCPSVIKYLKLQWDKIICCNVSTLTGMLAIQYMKNNDIDYMLEGDGAFAKSGRGVKERVKKHFISGASGYFSTSKALDNYYVKYGADYNKIHRYKFSSVSNSDILHLEGTEISEQIESRDIIRLNYRKELGIDEGKIVILTVGQFIYRKGLDVLLESASLVDNAVNFYFVGGEPTDEYKLICNQYNLSNIYFEGFKNSDELSKYYLAADIFVLPTREDIWGLVINEAMANALPVITTTRCVSGLEMVKENSNGYLIEPDNVTELSNKINKLVIDKDLRSKFGINSRNVALNYTIETMVESHYILYEEDFE